MVLAERNSELVRNGRRSRGPSPNGHGASSGSASGTAGAPGGTGTPETSSDDDNSIKRNGKSKAKQSEYEEKIRVGRDYQAVCPPLIPEPDRKPEVLNDRALLVWSPTKDIPDTKLEEYISVAKEKYGYNGEQALGMLFWHKHDLERAVMDLANFTPFPDEWTVEDKVLFEQAFQFHGKSFHRIRQMLPDKSIASLVKYYYSWKKTRHRQSVMDRQEKLKASKEGGSSENGSDNGSNEESDNDDKEQTLSSLQAGHLLDQTHDAAANYHVLGHHSGEGVNENDSNHISNDIIANKSHLLHSSNSSHLNNDSINSNGIQNVNHTSSITSNSSSSTSAAGYCSNCGVACNILNNSPHGKLCSSCHHHWRRTGNKRPTSGPYFGKRSRDRNAERHKRKPPRGMYINHDDIVALASSNDNQDELLANIDREIVSLLSQVQLNKQNISALKRKNSDNLEDIRPNENTNRINARWTNDEILLAVQGVRKYGKDFQAIAETLGTKTEAHVKTFYVNHRRRYNLDQIIKKFEADKESNAQASSANTTSSSSASSINNANITNTSTHSAEPIISGGSAGNTASNIKKDDLVTGGSSTSNQLKKKEIVPNSVNEESDNTTSSETGISKSTISTITTTTIDERKSESSLSGVMNTKDNIILEIDLDAEQSEIQPPSAKRIALSTSNQDFPKSSPA
ncbi:REST corepressor isoform 1-T5 [Cochliomyia hominivorax]